MADSTDIDALIIQARATARELNELLEKLSMGGVRVSVVQPPAVPGAGFSPDRVELGLVFPPERPPGTPLSPQERLMMQRFAEQLGRSP